MTTGCDVLPLELQTDVIKRAIFSSENPRSTARSLLLVCKRWSSQVQPIRCVLAVGRTQPYALATCPRRHGTSTPRDVSSAMASRWMRDAVLCGGDIPATVGVRWTSLTFLHMHGCNTTFVPSLTLSAVRAMSLEGVDFDAAGTSALCGGLRAALALEHLSISACKFDGVRGLFNALLLCPALRWLDSSVSLQFAALPQLTQLVGYKIDASASAHQISDLSVMPVVDLAALDILPRYPQLTSLSLDGLYLQNYRTIAGEIHLYPGNDRNPYFACIGGCSALSVLRVSLGRSESMSQYIDGFCKLAIGPLRSLTTLELRTSATVDFIDAERVLVEAAAACPVTWKDALFDDMDWLFELNEIQPVPSMYRM